MELALTYTLSRNDDHIARAKQAKHYSGHYKVTEKGNTCKRDVEKARLSTQKRQHRTDLDGEKWSVTYVLPGATRHIKSSTGKLYTVQYRTYYSRLMIRCLLINQNTFTGGAKMIYPNTKIMISQKCANISVLNSAHFLRKSAALCCIDLS